MRMIEKATGIVKVYITSSGSPTISVMSNKKRKEMNLELDEALEKLHCDGCNKERLLERVLFDKDKSTYVYWCQECIVWK